MEGYRSKVEEGAVQRQKDWNLHQRWQTPSEGIHLRLLI